MTDITGKIRLVLRIVFALLFLAAASAKLFGAPMMVQEFELFARYGIGQWFCFVTAAIEIAGALLLLRAVTAFYGALVLIGVCVGAAIAQATVIHQDVVHAIVMAGLLAWTGWGYRPGGPASR